jgi:predicted metalloendopeptidase
MWRVSSFSSYFLTKAIRKRQNEYANEVSGTEDEEPRWKECVDIVTGSVPIAIGAQYVRQYFKKESKAAALDMVNRIKAEFEKTLKTVPWMDNETRKSALQKLASMTTYIGYPDELMDDDKLIEHYKNLDFDESKYLETILNLNIFSTVKSLEKLHDPVDKKDWRSHGKPAVVNAYYSSIENSIRKLKSVERLYLHIRYF